MSDSSKTQHLVDGYRDGQLSRRELVVGAFKLGASVSGAAALLSACHSTSHKAAPGRLSGRVQILIGFDGGNTAPERQVQQSLAQAFIGAHPQVGIDFLRATSAAAAATQLTALVDRGAAPDVVLGIGLADVSRLVDQHTWLDLRPLFKRDGIATGAFQSQATSAGALSTYYGGTKAIPGVPLGIHDHALAYNAGLLSKAGITDPPASWSDGSWALTGSFLHAAQALTIDSAGKRADQAGFDVTKVKQFGVARLRPEAMLYSFGGHFYDASHRRAQFDNPAAISGAQFAGDLIGKYHVQPSPAQLMQLVNGSATGDNELAAWRAGSVAMIDLCSCEIDSQYGTSLPFAWKVAALPAGPARRFNFLEVSLGALVAAGTNHDLAWEVLKFFAVDGAREGQLAFNGFGAMPALSANLDAFASGTLKSIGVDPAVWMAGLPDASAENDNWIPAFADVRALATNAFTQVQAGAAASVVMPQLQQQAQSKIDNWFKTHKLP